MSLNPQRPIDPQRILGDYAYAHPVFDEAATRAQELLPTIQGQRRTWFAGAWAGYGFHEDGLKAGQAAATHLLLQQGRQPASAPAEALA